MQSSDTKCHSRITKYVIWRTKIRLYFRTCCCTCKYRKLNYPRIRRDENIVDDYHGTKVSDPYRCLEYPKSEEVKAFVEQQTKLTEKYLSKCCEREFILKRLTDLYDYPKYSCPFKRGNYYYYFKKKGMEPQMVLYQQEALNSESRTFVDLNITSSKQSALISFAFSEDGQIFSYASSTFGSDWLTVRFKNVDTLEEYPDVLERVKFTNMAWTHDNLGLFYSCYPKGPRTSGIDTSQGSNQKILYHRLGTSAEEDAIVAEFPDHPTWGIRAGVSNCGRYLVIYPWKYSGYNGLYYCDLQPYLTRGISKEICSFEVTPLVPEVGTHFYEYVTNFDSIFYIRTNKHASNYHVVGIDIHNPAEAKWVVKIPEDKLDVLEWTSIVDNDKVVACYSRHVRHVLKVFQLPEGRLIRFFDLENGSITCRSGKPTDSILFFKMESILNPAKIFYIDFENDNLEVKLFREIKPRCVDPGKYLAQKIFYPGKDGTKIPMFITHKKGLGINGDNFCRLYGYGGFGYNNIPVFSPQRLFVVENLQGVEALANIRGGGEYGEAWHRDGCHHQKQNMIDDFLAAAEYLISNKYTSRSKLAIVGASNGGLLVAACVNQRPDLFGAAIPIVGVMDLLRFHKFTIGSCWMTEYGVSEVEEDFRYIYKISPLHNIRQPDNKGQYPPVLVMTADHDNRVVPLHSLKYIAELQHKIGQLPQQKNPLMLRVDSKTGHGPGKGYSTQIQELVDIYSFLLMNMNLKLKLGNSR